MLSWRTLLLFDSTYLIKLINFKKVWSRFWNNIPGANKSLLLDIRGPEAVAEAVAADEDVGPVEDLAAADVPAIDEVYAVWKIAPAK